MFKAGVVKLVISSSAANNGSFSWKVPAAQVVGSDYKIRITSTIVTTITDSSDVNFAIS